MLVCQKEKSCRGEGLEKASYNLNRVVRQTSLKESTGEGVGDIWVRGRRAFRQREQPAQRLCRRNVPGLFQKSKGAQGIWIRENVSTLDDPFSLQTTWGPNQSMASPPCRPSAISPLFVNVKSFPEHNFEVMLIFLLYIIPHMYIFFNPFHLCSPDTEAG